MLLAQLRRRTATEAGGSAQNRVRKANSQLKNVHGSPFLTVPPVGICSAPRIYIVYFLKAVFDK